ncbi:hypothetical protein Glove_303g144 [Diversispora epigaea]|uniref:Potassium channel tetramerisation-type BTB domain-containing protein n=1 Tax=Diversispora epigaea TaxID=1348612 RepID=A0A397HW82_9GLOM|nr:hypothetical protein Glove_303g144 [Diversispora epigaea]
MEKTRITQGIKYEAKRSILGRNFSNPSNCNKEYFRNRDERKFYYIEEFYRTGKLIRPVTREEFEYFQILSEAVDTVDTVDTFDRIVSYFGKGINQIASNSGKGIILLSNDFEMTLSCDDFTINFK